MRMNLLWRFLVVLSAAAFQAPSTRAAEETDLQRRTDLPPLRYTNASEKIPNYPAGQKWGTLGDSLNQMQLPLAPAESAPHLVTRPEFTHQLWAAEPDILKPIC